ncbi:type VI secretion system tube protein Hcp [Chengkuizengella axinellae]|uniref:Type VI secretion system tube protein Hcp n=1 Tax=Chengkuizengella axinellae TaxID=3064388 RepID=A0ABT9J3Q2_9BACL|nr:type VI secretion system tube protein Hcp [Chengkuizengella sp. 2205SS18-9]MDP5276218.1 type VI secretion system tube protein Hcp [Chengkuizengella sp. 2205SS18-9]
MSIKKDRLLLLITAILISILMLVQPFTVMASTNDDIYLELEGVKGAGEVKGFEGAIGVSDFQMSMFNNVSTDSLKTTSKLGVNGITFTKPIDVASSSILQQLATNSEVNAVFNFVRQSDIKANLFVYYTVEVSKGKFTNYVQENGNETITLIPGQIIVTYYSNDGITKNNISFGWDFIRNQPIK